MELLNLEDKQTTESVRQLAKRLENLLPAEAKQDFRKITSLARVGEVIMTQKVKLS